MQSTVRMHVLAPTYERYLTPIGAGARVVRAGLPFGGKICSILFYLQYLQEPSPPRGCTTHQYFDRTCWAWGTPPNPPARPPRVKSLHLRVGAGLGWTPCNVFVYNRYIPPGPLRMHIP